MGNPYDFMNRSTVEQGPSTPVEFTETELWYLQVKVRHEVAGGEMWKYPPGSEVLNEQIGDALLFCQQNFGNLTQSERMEKARATLLLTRGHCFILDFWASPQDVFADGTPVGRMVLMKAWAARKLLRDGPDLDPEPALTREEEADLLRTKLGRLAEWKRSETTSSSTDITGGQV